MGGAHHALGAAADDGEALAFQPLLRIDDAAERAWAAEWIAALLDAGQGMFDGKPDNAGGLLYRATSFEKTKRDNTR
jgi:type IV secretory pathway VirB4 component